MLTNQEIELAMQEYKRLSQEVEGSLTRRLQIIEFGLTLLGVLIVIGVRIEDIGSFYFLSIGVPITCIMILILWHSEVKRTRRASWFLYGFERRMNSLLGRRIFRWEEDIRVNKKPVRGIFVSHYYATSSFFIFMASLSVYIGLSSWEKMPTWFPRDYTVALAFFSIVLIKSFYELHKLEVAYNLPDPSWPEIMPDELVGLREE